MSTRGETVIARCRHLATFTEEPGRTTRTFLSPPMQDVHRVLSAWFRDAGMTVTVDAAGNLRGLYPGTSEDTPRFAIGSHLDTVPDAGAFDGILGVLLGLSLIEELGGQRLPFAIELIAFSEEEGVRFATPFLGSRAVAGTFDADLLERRDPDGVSVREAIGNFGLHVGLIGGARLDGRTFGFLEFHIEQGPALEALELPLAAVEAIAGQTRATLRFQGRANHAGTTPMHLRSDALAAAAEWVGAVESMARTTTGLVATVGRFTVEPCVSNVVPGSVTASLDVRHADDAVRKQSAAALLDAARGCAQSRGVVVGHTMDLAQPAVRCDPALTSALEEAISLAGCVPHRMVSGAGHDAMVLASVVPVTMLFVRSPGGLSHHPDESVLPMDVEAALRTGSRLLELLASTS